VTLRKRSAFADNWFWRMWTSGLSVKRATKALANRGGWRKTGDGRWRSMLNGMFGRRKSRRACTFCGDRAALHGATFSPTDVLRKLAAAGFAASLREENATTLPLVGSVATVNGMGCISCEKSFCEGMLCAVGLVRGLETTPWRGRTIAHFAVNMNKHGDVSRFALEVVPARRKRKELGQMPVLFSFRLTLGMLARGIKNAPA